MEKVERRFSADIGVWHSKAVAAENCSQTSLASGICEVADWCNGKGFLPYLGAAGYLKRALGSRRGNTIDASSVPFALCAQGLRLGGAQNEIGSV